ncbi:MAG: DUF1513 domain-containing protein [Halothiobacillaceae bacterium]|nr:DUF1513 domain-containing protein [Halothiobacillaceae bacterium]HER35553.1 DUF1513 domain-containing protein [Halothiobacillaceae bacterium]
MQRRQFIALLAAAGVAPGAIFAYRQAAAAAEWQLAAQGGDGQFALSGSHGDTLRSVASGFRGHDLAQHPRRRQSVLMFARRPGTECIEADFVDWQPVKRFSAPPGHSFAGHGCFSRDGRRLFTSEIVNADGQGRVGIYDADSYQRLGEMPTGGIGPHDLALMPDGRTLVIANGGILTGSRTDGPAAGIDFPVAPGREKLNLDQMDSSLVYLDIDSGEITETVRLAEPKASIRHLDVADDGTVAVATQLQREAMDHDRLVPLAAIHRRGEAFQPLGEPEAVIAAMNDYLGSVTISQVSRLVGVTSPRGNLAGFWHLDSGAFAGHYRLQDVCGLAVSADHERFVLSNSFGDMRELDARTLAEDTDARRRFEQAHWDNHLITVTA